MNSTSSLLSANAAEALSAASTRRPLAPRANYWLHGFLLFAGDFASVFTAFGLAIFCSHAFDPQSSREAFERLYPVCLFFFAALVMQDLYPGALLHPAEEMRRVSTSFSMVVLAMVCVMVLGHHDPAANPLVLFAVLLLVIPMVLGTRSAIRRLMSKFEGWAPSAVIIGTGASARRLVRSLRTSQPGLTVLGVITDEDQGDWEADLPPILGNLHVATGATDCHLAQYAIVTMPDSSHMESRRLVEVHARLCHKVIFVPDLQGTCCLDIQAREVGGEIGIEVKQRKSRIHENVLKRAFDVAFSLTLILLLGPLWIILSFIIRQNSPGSVLFAHSRFGRGGNTFRALKFRTMQPNSDKILADHLAASEAHMQEWVETQKLKADPRLTSIGSFLRRYSIDELPQLFNVLRGEMSIVGPRPIVHSEIKRYGEAFDLYKSVTPGLTGLWQVSGRNNTSYPQRVAFDEYYVRNWSIWMDMYILTKTFKAVFGSEGAY